MHCMRKLLLMVGMTCLASWGWSQMLRQKDHQAILAIMKQQEMAWNAGNLEGFMQGYWEHDSLRFIGSRGITYGWQPTLAHYQLSYPDQAAMGKLSFTILRVEGLGKKWAHVTGKWLLQRAQDAPQGYFTLLWHKVHGHWVIVADHSS